MAVEIIVDVGGNHMGNKSRALAHITRAAQYGANAVKFQLYTKDTLYHPDYAPEGLVELPPEWLLDLKAKCDELSVEFLCTPFSPKSVETLDPLVKRWKVASGDLTYIPLLEAIGKAHKPVLLSVGFGTREEISRATDILWRAGGERPDLTYLYCTGGYPTRLEDFALSRIEHYSRWGWKMGLSSHVKEWWVDLMAVPYIAVLEKHFALDDEEPEAGHSLVGEELKAFVSAVRDCEKAWQSPTEVDQYGFTEADQYARDNYRRNPIDWLRPYKRQ